MLARRAGVRRVCGSKIAKILSHLDQTVPNEAQHELPLGARAPPQRSLF
jgi:hypothetical protein